MAITIESKDFHALFTATRDHDRRLYAELRKGLRLAAKPMVDDIKSAIDTIPSSGRYRSGVRAGLKAGTRASILASSARTAGVRITTSPSKLPAGKRPLAKAMNRTAFRHPVFADPERVRNSRSSGGGVVGGRVQSWVWVEQPGRPYFGEVIGKHYDDTRQEVERAYLRAAADLPHFTNGIT